MHPDIVVRDIEVDRVAALGGPSAPVSAGFTDQKSSATSSVLVAPSHRWKD